MISATVIESKKSIFNEKVLLMIAGAPAAAKSRTSGIYSTLRGEILAGQFPPGQKVKIKDLCQRFSVSVGMVREALARLAAEGFLTTEDQKGFSVRLLSVEDLTDLTETRIRLDTLALRLAIERRDADWEAMLMAANHRLQSTTEQTINSEDTAHRDDSLWQEQHAEFHRILVAGSGSAYLTEICHSLFERSEIYRHASARSSARPFAVGLPFWPHRSDEHTHLTNAVLAKDIDGAVGILREHYQKTTALIIGNGLIGPDADNDKN